MKIEFIGAAKSSLGFLELNDFLEHQQKICRYIGYCIKNDLYLEDENIPPMAPGEEIFLDFDYINEFLLEKDEKPLTPKQFTSGIRFFMVNNLCFTGKMDINKIYALHSCNFFRGAAAYVLPNGWFIAYCVDLHLNPNKDATDLFYLKNSFYTSCHDHVSRTLNR